MSSKPPRRVIPLKVERVSTLTPSQKRVVEEACAQHTAVPGALLPILHVLQDRLGFIPTDAVSVIAKTLNLSLAEVHGVISFYHYFRTAPSGRHVVHVCRAEACQAVGSTQLEAHVKKTLGIEYHGTTPDGAITLEAVYCLGNCALGPSILIDKRLQGRVTPQRFDELMREARAS